MNGPGGGENMVEKEAVIGYHLVLAHDDPLTYPTVFESQSLFLEVLVRPLSDYDFSKSSEGISVSLAIRP